MRIQYNKINLNILCGLVVLFILVGCGINIRGNTGHEDFKLLNISSENANNIIAFSYPDIWRVDKNPINSEMIADEIETNFGFTSVKRPWRDVEPLDRDVWEASECKMQLLNQNQSEESITKHLVKKIGTALPKTRITRYNSSFKVDEISNVTAQNNNKENVFVNNYTVKITRDLRTSFRTQQSKTGNYDWQSRGELLDVEGHSILFVCQSRKEYQPLIRHLIDNVSSSLIIETIEK